MLELVIRGVRLGFSCAPEVEMSKTDFSRALGSAFEERCPGLKLFVYDTIDSTSSEAKRYASQGGSQEAVFIAREQTSGRGRLGRSFLSSEGGLYLSYLFYPDIKPADAIMITVYTAVCLAEIIEELTPLDVGIKWVNDLIVGGKKLCGILTEGAFTDDGERFKYAVVGVGLNVRRIAFPDGLSDIATDIETECGSIIDISEISTRLAQRLAGFKKTNPAEYMDKYRSRSVLIGKRVRVERAEKSYYATVTAIEDDASLSVVTDDGREENIYTGEVSVRL